MLDFQLPVNVVILDVLRWITIAWLTLAMGWLVQIAVVTRLKSVAFLASGLCVSLFLDIETQYDRLGFEVVSWRLPLLVIELTLITIGMVKYVRSNDLIEFVRPFYLFVRFKQDRRLAP